nr:MAG TPA: effector protein [Caudoviricetes sp.]
MRPLKHTRRSQTIWPCRYCNSAICGTRSATL